MLLAALGFSLMGGSAKLLKGSFNTGQLVFFRNLVGAIGLTAAFIVKPTGQQRGKISLACFQGVHGHCCIVHLIVLCFAFAAEHSNDI